MYLLQMPLGHCDFTVHYMSVYSVTCELFIISSHFIWDITYLPYRWSAHLNLTGAAVLKCLFAGLPQVQKQIIFVWSEIQTNIHQRKAKQSLHYTLGARAAGSCSAGVYDSLE